jgi:3-dehydroquinate synthase
VGPDKCDHAFSADYTYRLRFTSDVFDPANATLRDLIAGTPSFREGSPRGGPVFPALVCIDEGVATAWPHLRKDIEHYFADGLRLADTLILPGGEPAKSDLGVVNRIVQAVHDHHICRHSFVVAVGGGAMLDAVGFAASAAHRGVRLIRIPTTTLAQGDAGIGVKNGINAFGKKNFLGTFTPPWAVINDDRFLTTLSDRDWRSGLSEAVKVALVKDASLFNAIEAAAPRLAMRDHEAVRPIIRRCAELHLLHIAFGGDPFEMNEARPLDFGHWAAHKLEQMTGFALTHGEAVAIGMAFDITYSAMTGRLDQTEADRILACLSALGFDLYHEAADDPALLEGLEEFREHLGGRLTIALLNGIGEPVDVHDIDADVMREAIAHIGRAPLARRG